MNKQFKKALFIFRRDLRLEDNTGLIYALEHSQEVIVCFIFTPEQIEQNPYKSNHCLQFMIESLEDLEKAVLTKKGRFYLFYGQPENVVEACIEKLNIEAVVVNRDYTPYSLQRDKKIELRCKKKGVAFLSFEDALLHAPDQTLKANGIPYLIFTPFYRHASQLEVLPPLANSYANYYSLPIPFASDNSLYKKILPKRSLKPSGGRTLALKILENLGRFTQYKSIRDLPAESGTTYLSSHLKFTTCSPREIYWAIYKQLGPSSELIRSLYWRDFFTSIAFYFPQVFSGAFKPKFDRLQWSDDEQVFRKWCEGKTGFPIVDAGMREMNQM